MPFRLAPKASLHGLAAGDSIDASVDTRTQPWTLRTLRVVARTSLIAAPSPLPAGGAVLTVGERLPQTAFLDQSGHPFTLDVWRGSTIVLGFVYTRCRDPQMCPLVSAKFARLQKALGPRRLHLIEVTLDPAYDRPAILARYGRMYGADPHRWTFATGSPKAVLAFAARFGIVVEGAAANGDLVHSERIVVADPAGSISALIDDPAWQPQDLLADIDAEPSAAASTSRGNPAIRAPTLGSQIRDVTIVVLILGAFGYITIRIARAIFIENL